MIIDCAAGLGDEATSVMETADEIILVSNPEMPAITDALKTIKMAERLKTPVKGAIMTRVKKNGIELSPETVKDMLESDILGMIPEDIHVSKALSEKDAVVHTHPKSKAARAYKEIAAQLADVDYNSATDTESVLRRYFKGLGLLK